MPFKTLKRPRQPKWCPPVSPPPPFPTTSPCDVTFSQGQPSAPTLTRQQSSANWNPHSLMLLGSWKAPGCAASLGLPEGREPRYSLNLGVHHPTSFRKPPWLSLWLLSALLGPRWSLPTGWEHRTARLAQPHRLPRWPFRPAAPKGPNQASSPHPHALDIHTCGLGVLHGCGGWGRHWTGSEDTGGTRALSAHPSELSPLPGTLHGRSKPCEPSLSHHVCRAPSTRSKPCEPSLSHLL
nr:uncharacterized protein LOC129474225 [Symphalangus syndactylus]